MKAYQQETEKLKVRRADNSRCAGVVNGSNCLVFLSLLVFDVIH